MSQGRHSRQRSTRAGVPLLLLALAFLSCKDGRHPGAEAVRGPRPLDAVAGDYVRLALALGERDPDSLDFAVVPDSLRAEMHARYLTLDSIGNQAGALRDELEAAPHADPESGDRAAFLALQLAALAARTAMLRGRTLPFDAEAEALFATSRLPDRWARQRQAIRAQVLALLPPGDPPRGPRAEPPAASEAARSAERYAAYDRRFLVLPDRLAAVMNAALGACRKQTALHLPLPPGESVELRFVRNQPWSAFSRYRGAAHSTISINLDLPLTVDDVLELACHEGYPGHHVFNTLRDQALATAAHRPEAAVQTTFSPQSYVSEAAAANAPRLAFSLQERSAVERTLLFPLAGLPTSEPERYVKISSLVRGLASAEPAIVRDYLDDRLEFARAAEALAREALMAHAEPLLLYTNEYRSYMLAYTDGPERIAVLLGTPGAAESYGQTAEANAQAKQAEWSRYRQLTGRMVYRLP